MRLIKVKNYEEMSIFAAREIIKKVRSITPFHLGLATGSTPLLVYKCLVEDYKKNKTSYQHVHTYNLDEYIGLSSEDSNSYNYYMNKHLFNHINIRKENIHIPNGICEDSNAEAKRYEQLIDAINGVDLQLLGIGENGHIGFNEPGTSFEEETHVAELTASTRQANARFFHSLEQVPTHAVTMGIATILKSNEILLLASGEKKADAVYQLFSEQINENCPAAALRNHRNVTVIADEGARARLEKLYQI